ncbi:MAG: tRNA uridine-5-carboxymethylaminomethyl(34) synthesis GTPase MnmE [Lachnospiraceae bacterium]|nr:tRNA uridine-5-carboxymethylaminomethyl(34) synthesis GTPase MnmE [Lachnospiraceae bacterium]
MENETIAAIATPAGNGGIGIIRVSGEHAFLVVHPIYCNRKKEHTLLHYQTHTIHYGFICDGDDVVDEVMVTVMKAPHTYTTEHTVEINCHGGMFIMNRILSLVLANGARLAEPGEFTKRAFLNGRIDLSEAEAVMDILRSKNDLALKASMAQLKGSVSLKIKELRAHILHEIAFIESALDDPEHISLDGYQEQLLPKIKRLSDECMNLIRSADQGKMIKEGIRTVIVGKPNAGKSSLLNLLLGEEKAIVTDIAGTTRDTLEESLMIGEIQLNIVDTAGIRDTQDKVEKIGVERAKSYAADADLIIYVVDSSAPLDENDEEIIHLLKNKKVIVLMNKSDLKSVITEDELKRAILTGLSNEDREKKNQNESYPAKDEKNEFVIIKTSTASSSKTGMQDLEKQIHLMFMNGEISENSEVMITNIRHKEALIEAHESLGQVMQSIISQMPEDFYSIDLMSAYASLGSIIGEEVGEDLVNEIFSKFCMGK